MIDEKIFCSADTSSAFHGAWAKQLQCEFADICYQYSLPLTPPVIEILASVTVFGTWRGNTRTIGISRHLITNHSWDVVVNVLKHEMAHQICDELLQLQGRPHDRDFLRACDMLGLPKSFCRAAISSCDLSSEPVSENGILDKRGQLIEKIRKLLALSASANEHEALAALQMAARMMKKHKLDRGDIDEDDNQAIYRILPLAKKRVPTYQRMIVSLLSRYFRVTVIHSQLYDAASDQVYKTFEIFGRQDNVEIAEYCYHFLEYRLAALWRTYRKAVNTAVKRSKNSYYLGILHGFSEKIQKEQDDEDKLSSTGDIDAGTERAYHPAIYRDQRIEECIKRRYPRLKRVKKGASRVSLSVFQHGVAAGRELTLSEALQDKNETNRPRLLA
jgi:hypothetical protein